MTRATKGPAASRSGRKQAPGTRSRRGAEAPPAAVRILVADTLPLDRRSMGSLLATQPDFLVVGEAATVEEAARQAAKLEPSLVVLALRMGGAAGRTPVLDLRASAPTVPVLAIAERGEGECLVLNPPTRSGVARGDGSHAVCSMGTDCLQIAVAEGASGTIRRNADPEVFFHAVRTVASGQPWYEPRTATAIMRHALAPHQESGSHGLSTRELDVAELIAAGRSNKEIAQALTISEPTVKKHVGHILGKLGLQDRLQVGLYVARNPLVLRTAERGRNAPKSTR